MRLQSVPKIYKMEIWIIIFTFILLAIALVYSLKLRNTLILKDNRLQELLKKQENIEKDAVVLKELTQKHIQLKTKLDMTIEQHKNELEQIKNQNETLIASEKKHSDETSQTLKESFQKEREHFKEVECNLKKQYNENLTTLQQQWKDKAEEMKNQFENLAHNILEQNTSKLKSSNASEMNTIVSPLKEQFKKFEESMLQNKLSSAKEKASLEEIIKLMMNKTEELGKGAEKLTNALTNNGKTQGDFGEMVLENILENSGLEENVSFFKQKSYEIGEGKRFRPDVVVKFPENRSIIIDAKTSLTAYNNYINAETEQEKEKSLKSHLESVKKHIDELSAKDYTKLEDNIIGYVLLFMPNEGAYILAVNHNLKDGNKLINTAQYAYNKRVILINPTNLMMALQLAKNLWISADQKKNIQEIVRQGSAMYDKFVGFIDDFEKIGKQLDISKAAYAAALNKLSNGKGNLLSRAEKMRKLGLDTNKQLSIKSNS